MLYPWNNVKAADIETTGLLKQMKRQEHPRLHNIGYIDMSTKERTVVEWTERKQVQDFLDTGPTLVMHNGATFDFEALQFLGYDVSKCTLIDTLYISWYLEPKRVIHGLDSYGEDFGIPKPKIEDWENQTQEEYNHRVMEDCRIQAALWEHQYAELLQIYKTPAEVKRFVEYLMTKSRQQVIQQRTRWRLNKDKAIAFRDKLTPMIQEKVTALEASMPKIPEYVLQERPKKTHKNNGTLTALGIKWKAICDANGLDWKDPDLVIKKLKGYKEPNANSHVQLKDWLFSLGWKPQTFKFDRNKETGETRQIPQITVKDEDGNPEICPSLHELAEEHPGKGIEHLIGLGVYKHRLSVVNGFLRDVDDEGFLTAECGGLTNTLRLKHRQLVNLPSVRVFGGAELRAMLEAEDDTYEQLGSDLASLEDRCKHHFQWQYDPEYVKKQLADDYDAHLAIGVIGGFITEEQSQAHKDNSKLPPEQQDKSKKVKQRPMFKTTNYACQYGAGVATVTRSAKCDPATGARLHKAYWDLNWSIKEIAANTVVKQVGTKMWQQNPVNGFWYSLRSDKDRFSTLCQGTGAYVFDIWCNNIIEICNERYGQDPKLSGQFHDELILQVKKGYRELWTGILHEAMERTNKQLKLNRDCACDVQFGDNYAQIH